MSTVDEPREPTGRFYPPDEALKRARPLPVSEDMRIEGLTDDERRAFLDALAEL